MIMAMNKESGRVIIKFFWLASLLISLALTIILNLVFNH